MRATRPLVLIATLGAALALTGTSWPGAAATRPGAAARTGAAAATLTAGRTATAGPTTVLATPVRRGRLRITGALRDGGTVRAAGLRWRPGALPHGDKLLSFEIAYAWRSCASACRTAADSTATPFAARRYIAGHADTGRRLRLTETATEVIETDPATFAFTVVHALGERHHGRGRRRLPGVPSAGHRVRQRHARAPHGVRGRVFPGRSAPLQLSRR